MCNAPHAPSRLAKARSAPRCNAERRDGFHCRQPAMPNGRCRMHGGMSTGARTADGLERCRMAVLKHGHYTAERRAERREAAAGMRGVRQLMAVF